jgi:hypothetical protein
MAVVDNQARQWEKQGYAVYGEGRVVHSPTGGLPQRVVQKVWAMDPKTGKTAVGKDGHPLVIHSDINLSRELTPWGKAIEAPSGVPGRKPAGAREVRPGQKGN